MRCASLRQTRRRIIGMTGHGICKSMAALSSAVELRTELSVIFPRGRPFRTASRGITRSMPAGRRLPRLGRYLSPEPLLQDPDYLMSMASRAMAVPSYAYAFNNSISLVDPDGLAGTCSGGKCATNAAGEIIEPGSASSGAGSSAGTAAAQTASAAAAAAAQAKLVEAACKKKEETRRLCREHYEACIRAGGERLQGNQPGETRCDTCQRVCNSPGFGFWPEAVYGPGGSVRAGRWVCPQ
jgi:hypothetical protein